MCYNVRSHLWVIAVIQWSALEVRRFISFNEYGIVTVSPKGRNNWFLNCSFFVAQWIACPARCLYLKQFFPKVCVSWLSRNFSNLAVRKNKRKKNSQLVTHWSESGISCDTNGTVVYMELNATFVDSSCSLFCHCCWVCRFEDFSHIHVRDLVSLRGKSKYKIAWLHFKFARTHLQSWANCFCVKSVLTC